MRSKLARCVSAGSLGIVLLTSRPARADEWYGYQTLAADGAATSLLVGAAVADGGARKGLFIVSATTYIVASPIIHAANGREGAAFGALGLRLVAPVAFGLLGILVGTAGDHRGSWGAPLVGGLIGLGVGVVTAMAIDAAALARKESPVAQGASALSVGRELYLPFGGTF